jgi:hypothetical protein
MLATLLEFYERYPSNLFELRNIRRDELAPDLLEELDLHGKKQSEILNAAQVYLLDAPAQLMLLELSAKMKQDGLESMYSHVQLPFPAMLLTVPAPSEGKWPLALVTQHEDSLYTQVFHDDKDAFLPNFLIFKSQGRKVEALHTPTFKIAKAIGDNITEEQVADIEKPSCFSFLSIVVGMSVLLQHKAMLETEEVPAYPRAERRRAQKAGRPLPNMRVLKVRLGDLGMRQLQAMQDEAQGDHAENTKRRAHWVQGHFMRNRAGGISWRNPHVRGAGPIINQERHVSV